MPDENQNLRDLVTAVQHGLNDLVLFVGAGLSRPLFPSWPQLLSDLVVETAQRNKLPYDQELLLRQLEEGRDYLDIADICADSLGPSVYREFLERNLDGEIEESAIPQNYRYILRTMNVRTIITTNYDRIPDVGGRGDYRIFTNKQSAEALRAIEGKKKVVFKVHGDITDQNSLVLGRADFNRLIYDDPSTQNLMRAIFSSKKVLFVGFGLSDPHINLHLDNLSTISKGISLDHYAIMPTENQYEVDKLERRYRIKVISYTAKDETHGEFLEVLKKLSEPEPFRNSSPPSTPDEGLKEFSHRIRVRLTPPSLMVNSDIQHKAIVVTITPRGRTEYELQQELLILLSMLDFQIDQYEAIVIQFHREQPTADDFMGIYPPLLVTIAKLEDVNQFANKSITAKELWSTLHFNKPQFSGPFQIQGAPANPPYMDLSI